jgi:branched-chain amino acid aminotransferase
VNLNLTGYLSPDFIFPMSASILTQKTTQSRLSSVDWDNLPFGQIKSDHMLVSDFDGKEWSAPTIMPYGPMSMDPAMSALHYGQSIFEGLKAYRGADERIRIFRPEANAARLNASAFRMCMAQFPEELFLEGLYALISLDEKWVSDRPGYSLYIRPFMFATEAYLGIKPSETFRFAIITSPVGAYYQGPIKVKVETEYTRAAQGGTGAAKAAGNYAASLYPAKLGQEKGYRQLIWTDAAEHRYIEESGTMNLFVVMDGVLVTPPLDSGTILPGITRDSILTIARSWGMAIEERKIEVTELRDAIQDQRVTELFGAGTAATIAQIELIHILGEDFPLPPADDRPFSNKIAVYLDDLKFGRVSDPFGWVKTL